MRRRTIAGGIRFTCRQPRKLSRSREFRYRRRRSKRGAKIGRREWPRRRSSASGESARNYRCEREPRENARLSTGGASVALGNARKSRGMGAAPFFIPSSVLFRSRRDHSVILSFFSLSLPSASSTTSTNGEEGQRPIIAFTASLLADDIPRLTPRTCNPIGLKSGGK